MKYTSNGQYVLNDLKLVKDNITIDLTDSFADIMVYESVFDHFMTASISVLDTFDLTNQLPIDGEERIVIDFQTAGTENAVHFEGNLYRIVEDHGPNGQTKGLVLHFVSEAGMMNQRIFERGGYKGNTSEIAKRVFPKIRYGGKVLDVEPTTKIENVVFPTVRPSVAMDLLANKSISTTSNVGYLFYENKDAFHFKSIQSLMQKTPELAYLNGFGGVYEEPENAIVEKFNTYQAFEELEPSQFMDKVQKGYYGSDYASLDLYHKRFEQFYESRESTFDQNKSLGQYANRQDHPNPSYQDRMIFRAVMHDQGMVNLFQRKGHVMTALDNYRAIFSVFGDSTVGAGATCFAVVPIKGTSRMEDPNDFHTGKFLISEVKHRVTADKYMQTMTIIKDSFEETANG